MTIDEFVRDIAPKMRPGWVAMDEWTYDWYFYAQEPTRGIKVWLANDIDVFCLSNIFDIAPVEDWKQSLRNVGCDE